MIIDFIQIKRLEKEIRKFGKKGKPTAIRNTLNRSNMRTFQGTGRNIKKDFVNKNKWTYKSNRFQKATTLNMNKMYAESGSVQGYMAKQHKGFTEHSTGKHGVQVPTGDAAGQPGSRQRTKTIKKRFFKSKITLLNSSLRKERIKNERQKRMVVARMAVKTKNRYYFGTFGGTTGLWYMKGGRISKKNKGWPKGLKPTLLYSASKRSVRIPPTNFHKKEGEKALRLQAKDYKKELRKVLEKMKKDLR